MPFSLHNTIKKWDTSKLLKFLGDQGLHLDGEDFMLLKNQKISGPSFLLLEKEDLVQCQLKLGPVLAISNLIIEINSGKFSHKRMIPCIQYMESSKWPYVGYFNTFSFEKWSLKHFKMWISENYYQVPKKEVYNQHFFKMIRKVVQDPRTLDEVREIVSTLDK